MKIKFNLGQLLILITIILILYNFGPMVYDAWINPKYKHGHMTESTIEIRIISGIILFLLTIPYLIITKFEILTKKREINLTPWKSTN